MEFVLSKILLFLVQPLNWLIIFLLAGLIWKKKRYGRFMLVAGVAGLVFFTNPLVLNLVTRAWESEPILINQVEGEYEVGIVLGGYSRVLEKYPDRIHLNAHPNRLIHAIQLYQAGKIKTILLTGGSPALIGNRVSDTDDIKQFLVRSGIPDTDILTESESRNTRENAKFSAEILNAKAPGARCLLITSASHMRRATACFEMEGINVTPFATDQTEDSIDHPTPEALFLPKASAFSQWNMLIKEWIGLAYYKIRGYA